MNVRRGRRLAIGSRGSRLASVACWVAGAVAAGGLAVAVDAGTALRGDGAAEPWIEATHFPPLLTAGEAVELRYDVYCSARSEEQVDEPCDATGAVHARAGTSGAFRELPLRPDPTRASRFVAQVPDDLAQARNGFTYYAELRSPANGTVTLPAGGAESPHRSVPLGRPTVVHLGRHAFGQPRAASDRVVEATWGAGPNQVGLEQGRNLPPIGGSSFDVDDEGTVHVLDEANRRFLRWRRRAPSPERVPLAIAGTIADLAVSADGTIHVLETAAAEGGSVALRAFDGTGAPRGALVLPERASVLRSGPDGPLVQEQPSGLWVSSAAPERPLASGSRLRPGRPGRPLRGSGEIMVLRHGEELRIALVDERGARRSWQVTSGTPLAEVQLAEPLGNGLLVVARVYTDEQAEFAVLVLDDRGLAHRFSLPSADWAETAPLSRFRLARSSLYQLGSTPAGLFVDRFDLEVK
jgi:hypothetical protein